MNQVTWIKVNNRYVAEFNGFVAQATELIDAIERAIRGGRRKMTKFRIEKESLVSENGVTIQFVVLKHEFGWVTINSFDTYEEAENYIKRGL